MSKSSDGPFQRIEVITSVQRCRRWSVAEKVRLVEDAMQPGMSVSYVARRAGISPSQLFAWKRRMLEGGRAAVHADENVVGASQVRELEKRVRELKRMLGKKTMAAEILKEALELARPKNGRRRCCRGAIQRAVANERDRQNAGRLPVEPDRTHQQTVQATRILSQPDDIVLLAELRPIIDQRPTYGYRRVTALLNRQRRRDGLPMVNAKSVLRVMQQNGLTLQKHTALRPTRAHDGVVVALRSNIRWCSDHLEIHARNGEVVRILFVIDACDREIIA